jgi:N,N'-diacetyllegionaminate synthase
MLTRSNVLIIAEAGVNHNGDIELAKKLIDIAEDAQADIVKFQTFKTEQLVSQIAGKADYQKRSTGENESQFAMIKRLELDLSAHQELLSHCDEKSVQFLSTPFDMDSIDLLQDLKLPLFKIPSGEITNLPYLRKIASMGKPVILSTGMSDLDEIEDALNILTSDGLSLDQITVLHCNTEYPTPFDDVNLKAMRTIADAFPGISVGYSDHTLGIEVPIAAVAMGATVIEKHFTLDKTMDGPDHTASLEPNELKAMVSAIRNIEKALGHGMKKLSPSEMKNRSIARKSLVAAKPIKKGDLFSEENIAIKRPGTGISPMQWDNMLGQVAQKSYHIDEVI